MGGNARCCKRIGRDKNPVEAGLRWQKNPNRKRRNRPLTLKQQNYFKLLCKGMSATEAARRAGYGEPAHSAYQATRGIRERM